MTPPGFWRLLVHEALPSTSDLCRQLAEAGEPEGLAVLARRQTAGRGTHGRMWISPPGNLFLSVLLRPPGPVARSGLWGLLAAVAVAEALTPLLPDPACLRLKWPNDVMLNGAKLAGLLAEVAADDSGRLDWLVIGIGVNLATAPEVSDRLTACVGVAAPKPEDVAHVLLGRLQEWRLAVLRDGFAAVRAAWLALGPDLGSHVTLKIGTEVRGGSFAGLAEDGSLLLNASGLVRAFAAGET